MEKQLRDLYTDYLIASFGPTTATGLSRLLDDEISHDRITRLLGSERQTAADLWNAAGPLVRQVERDDAVLIIDDTIEEKPYTDENEIVCWHFDHAKGRTVKGIGLITALYSTAHEGQALSVPVSFDLVEKTETYLDEKTGTEKRRSPVTKNERVRQMLTACCDNKLPFRYVVADLWYGSAENMRYVKLNLEREFIFPLKSNRKVALSLADKQAGRFQAVQALDLEPDRLYEAHVEGVPFALRLMRQVFTNEDGSHGERYLVSSDVTLKEDTLSAIYQRRWRVEEYHKSLKQNAALAKSPTRRETTQTNHLFCSLLAFVKLERLKLTTSKNHFALKAKLYMKAIQSAFAELQQLGQGGLALSPTA
jgi:hypothetical protein